MTDRYSTLTNLEGQYQPGSNNLVLLNKLGITDLAEINQLELELLADLTELEEGQILSSVDLCEWHRRWLGNVYVWAGNYRSVNMSKGDFQFATASLIPDLMNT